MSLNPEKTKDMWICFKEAIPEPPQLWVDRTCIERVNAFKQGVMHQDNLKWNSHVEQYITKKASKRLFFLRECHRANLPTEVGITCYVTKIKSLLEYGAPIRDGIQHYLENELKGIQMRSFKILGLPHDFFAIAVRQKRQNDSARIPMHYG